MKLITFRSYPENFEKEISGKKANTVRFMEDWGVRKMRDFNESNIIKIVNTDTGEYFIRTITDKTVYKNLAIISWSSNGN